MSKVMNELQKEIERLQNKLDQLRKDFDRYNDSNAVNAQIEVALQITSAATSLECLKDFQRAMREKGEE